MPRLRTGWSWEALCLLIFVAVACCELFVRPVLGIADNGDFPKVLAPNDVCNPVADRDEFAYISLRYEINPECQWDLGLRSSEALLVQANKAIAEWNDRKGFSITGAGKIHFAILLLAISILLWGVHESAPLIRYGVPAAAILILTDVAYLAYCNSFYMDAATLVTFALTMAAAVAGVFRPRAWVIAIYGIAGVLMAFSKTQHVVSAILVAAMGLWFAARYFSAQRSIALAWGLAGVAILASSAAMLRMTPYGYKAEPFYSLIFYRMLPRVSDQVEVLKDLGLPDSYFELIGTHAYSEKAAIKELDWRVTFIKQIGYGKLASFYLRSPDIALQLLWRALNEDAHGIRPGNLGNYARTAGRRPGALSHSFGVWSDMRSWLFRVLPLHIVLLYLAAMAGSIACLFRKRWAAAWPLYPFALALSISGTVEFSMAALLDGTETGRHLFFFHVVTEALILVLLGALLASMPSWYRSVRVRTAARPAQPIASIERT
jgi:hypothetical protein